MSRVLLKQCIAESIGTFALKFIGVGVIGHDANLPRNTGLLAGWLGHGFTIAVIVSATAGISNGHLNPADTFGLLVDRTALRTLSDQG